HSRGPLTMPAKPKPIELKLHCPECGTLEGCITVDLRDLDAITCSECGEEFTAEHAAAKAAEQAKRWGQIAEWLETARAFSTS
ncbi:MAG: hypothetical protein ABI353_18180, partial [Isosphaeraceae bacterium]